MVYPGGSMSGGAKRKQNQSLFTREKELQTLTEKLIDYKQRAINFTNKVEQKKADVARLTTTLAEEEKALQHNERILQQLKEEDRKSTRLNSSHVSISYAVFCLKKK